MQESKSSKDLTPNFVLFKRPQIHFLNSFTHQLAAIALSLAAMVKMQALKLSFQISLRFQNHQVIGSFKKRF